MTLLDELEGCCTCTPQGLCLTCRAAEALEDAESENDALTAERDAAQEGEERLCAELNALTAERDEAERLWERLTDIVEESFGWQVPANKDELLTILEREIHETHKRLVNDLTKAERELATALQQCAKVADVRRQLAELEHIHVLSTPEQAYRDAWRRLNAAIEGTDPLAQESRGATASTEARYFTRWRCPKCGAVRITEPLFKLDCRDGHDWCAMAPGADSQASPERGTALAEARASVALDTETRVCEPERGTGGVECEKCADTGRMSCDVPGRAGPLISFCSCPAGDRAAHTLLGNATTEAKP